MSTPSIAERVAAGGQWLDKNRPGWWKRVDLERLELDSCIRCVLGQEYGHYLNARLGETESQRHGFQAGIEDDIDAEYADLTSEWRRVIQERRQAVGETP